MKKLLAALAAIAVSAAVLPSAAGADEPLGCKIVNSAYKKVTKTDDTFMYCIDDPIGPGDPI